MAAPRPGNPDRGWNDPPMFSYTSNTNVQSNSPKRTQLNKRVAYPSLTGPKPTTLPADGLLNPSDGPPTSPVQLLPPKQSTTLVTTTTAATPIPLLIPAMSSACPLTVSSVTPESQTSTGVRSLEETLQRLSLSTDTDLLDYDKEIFGQKFEKYLPKLQGRAVEDIRRKLQIFTESWLGGKLSDTVKVKISEIAEAVKQEKYEEAWNYHLMLMVDHTAEVNQWLVAVKKIIHEAKEEVRIQKEAEGQTEEVKGQTEDSAEANSEENGKPSVSSDTDLGSSVDPPGTT